MTYASFCCLCALLCLVVQGKQHALPVPEIVSVYSDKSSPSAAFGVWKMNVEWRDNSISGNNPEQVTYDVEIFQTEHMRLVHNETLAPTDTHQWSWTSPLPLQCTSHSVRLRSRHQSHTSDWTPLYTLKGNDTDESHESHVYPIDYVGRVGEDIVFCCVLKPESVENFRSSTFTIRISDRTYISEPVRHNSSSPAGGFDMHCDDSGSTYFIGYAPDVKNLTCETRDLGLVECRWSRGETGEAKVLDVQYTVNGRVCSHDKCVLDDNIDSGVMNWTLTAKNVLGVKIISDIADPKHRVQLKAPSLAHAALVHARNATLQWQWDGMSKSSSFPMMCQVEENGHTRKETFRGTGLESLVLADLQPFTRYSARVRCGSLEHFYKWGDWSDPITFNTKEDIPEAVDVWMQVIAGDTYVVWKNLTASQSHGIITGFELLLGSTRDENKERISKATNEHYFKLRSTGDHIISVSAKNSAGVSPPSSITIPKQWSDAVIITDTIKGYNGSFNMSWDPSSISSCGYVVDWFETHRNEQCAVKWMKIPPGVTNVTVFSDFVDGVKYTLSVYACTSGAPQLLQRREGYVKELVPSGSVGSLIAEKHGTNVKISWQGLREEEKRGFILGYNVSYNLFNGEENRIFIQDPSRTLLLYLHPGEYTCSVKAVTSAGEGPEAKIQIHVNQLFYSMVISILVVLGTAACAITTIVLCCSKKEWLKAKLYPDTPKPVLSGEWHTHGFHKCHLIDETLLAESEVLMVKNPESCLLVVPHVQKAHDELDLKSKDPPWTKYCNDDCDQKTVSRLTVDNSYLEVPSPGIHNPTYNIPLALPDDDNLVLGYIPQIQNVNNQLQPYDVRPVQMDSMGYQPQSQVLSSSPEIPNETSLPRHSTLIVSSEYLLHNACS